MKKTRPELWAEMREAGRLNFIAKCQEVHQDRVDLSEIEYHNSQTPVTLRCTIHNVRYSQKPNNALMGKTGCPKCTTAKKREASPTRLTTAEFIAKCKAVHGDKYDYSKTVYVSAHKPATITCPIHGDFEQIVRLHHMGCGCPSCGNILKRVNQLDTPEEFLALVRSVHGDKYDYTNANYTDNLAPVKIVCRTHGAFYQTPKDHKKGNGCPKCGFAGPSKPELEVADYVRSLFAEGPAGTPQIEIGNRQAISPYELDIYLPEHKLAIEFNGVYYHSEKFIDKRYHLDKLERCQEAGIDLLQVFSDEWEDDTKQKIIKSIIASRLGKNSRKVFARNTKVVELTAATARQFLTENHLQGFAASSKYYGLETKQGELVSVMLLTPPRKGITVSKKEYELELVRFASLRHTTVVGGFSKLLKQAQNKSVVTYCDRRVFNAKGYEAVGFEKLHHNPPEYYYAKSRSGRLSRLGFQKQHLAKKLENYDPSKTERQNMLANGYLRVYGCGTTTLVLNTRPPASAPLSDNADLW